MEEILTRGVTNILIKENLEKKLKSGKKLRVKLGIDPTGAKLHIGRAIPLWKLRNFQDHGHKIIFIIGDTTAQIGDASDKHAERVMLTKEQVIENMKGYIQQVGKILDMKHVEIRYNSEWLEKMGFAEIANLATHFSISQMLDRDNFSKRHKKGLRIGLQEFLYPLMQGYDSVMVHADLEIGGNDQYFNLLAGRTLQKAFGQEPQDIMTFELLEGLDGQKMSTTHGNTISIIDEPSQQFGKIMSMKDEYIVKYLTICTQLPMSEIKKIEKDIKAGANPRDAKMRLGFEIVKLYHGLEEATKAKEAFIAQFSHKEKPENIPTYVPSTSRINIIDLIVEAGMESSKANARRVVEQGGVKVDDKKVIDIDTILKTKPGMIIQVGKRRFIEIADK